MAVIANKEIRERAKAAGIRLWQIADSIGISDATFSRKLRRELPAKERSDILDIISDLSMENGRVADG